MHSGIPIGFLRTIHTLNTRDIPEGHLCCGSAGTYTILKSTILESDIALQLRDRKIANILRTSPDLIATGNIGCMTQIASGTSIPVLHTIELLDYAYGGLEPVGLDKPRIQLTALQILVKIMTCGRV